MTETSFDPSGDVSVKKFMFGHAHCSHIIIIRHLIARFGYNSYLEIGVSDFCNYDQIDYPRETAVDPHTLDVKGRSVTDNLTSDCFSTRLDKEIRYDPSPHRLAVAGTKTGKTDESHFRRAVSGSLLIHRAPPYSLTPYSVLRFFHAPVGFTLEANVRFPVQRFRGSEQAKQNDVIPFSHLYLTSASQLAHFNKFLVEGQRLVTLPDNSAGYILAHRRCPVNLTFRDQGLARALAQGQLVSGSVIRIAIVNGMGRGYGDNVAGLGVLQHLRKFLGLHYGEVVIDLLQRNSSIQGVIHERYDAVSETVQLPISVTRFFGYDGYFDLSDLLSIPQFSALPLYEFFLHALSLQHEVKDGCSKRTELVIKADRRNALRAAIRQRLGSRSGKIPARYILFHPTASTPLRSMPPLLVQKIVDTLLGVDDVVIVTCVHLMLTERVNSPRLVDLSNESKGINDFLDIIASCDAVITVGTVVYHVSGNHDIPTLLIPTVQADVDSAALLPAVESYLPDSVKQYISPKHMSRLPEDIASIQPVWDAVDMGDVLSFIGKIQ